MAHEFDGKKYEQASSHQKEWGSRLIDELSLRGDEIVLDLGCGDGALTVKIADLVPSGRVVGIDASSGMIEIARQKQRNNLQFILMDINDIHFSNEFDIVFSNAALHWVVDHKLLLQNAYRALRTNGLLRINFGGDGNCANFLKVIREAMSQDEFSQYFTDFQWPWYMPSIAEYESILQQSAFSDIHIWGENADRFFLDAQALIGWIDQPSIVPFLVCVPDEVKATFREFVINRMIEETMQGDGSCFETFRRINVIASK